MALKDEPSPKYMFPGAGTSLLKSYKKLAVGAEITVSFSRFLRAAATGHGRCSGCCRSSRQQNTTAAALAAAAAPGSKTPWP